MNKAVRMAIAAAFGVATAMPAFAEDRGEQQSPGAQAQYQYSPSIGSQDRHYRGGLDWSMAGSSNELGSPAGDLFYDREVRLGSNSNVGVSHGETVKFITPDGKEFRWRFDTLARITTVPLASIAPGGNLPGRVYVQGEDPAS